MIKRTNIYETLFIINPLVEGQTLDKLIEKVKENLTKIGATINSTNLWGLKRLTYNIKNKNNGFYVLIEFTAPAESISSLERFFNLEEEIVRHLIIKLDKNALKAKAAGSTVAANKESKNYEIDLIDGEL